MDLCLGVHQGKPLRLSILLLEEGYKVVELSRSRGRKTQRNFKSEFDSVGFLSLYSIHR